MTPYRICFAGTPEFAAGHLSALIESPHEVVAVYTQPDRPSGRGKKTTPTPVKALALDHELPVLQPLSLRSAEAERDLQSFQPDLLIVVAYGLILPQAILDVPRLCALNVHASLLPRWRGAAPIERALLAGDPQTGITIMQMEAGLDTGPMLLREPVPINADDDRNALEQKLLLAGKRSLLVVLQDLPRFLDHAQTQDDSLSTYAAKLEKQESEIDWARPAVEIDRLIRASVGRTPAYTEYAEQRVRVLGRMLSESGFTAPAGTIIETSTSDFTVACGEGTLRVSQAQLPGRKMLPVADLRNARPDLFGLGDRLGTQPNSASNPQS